eukprot:CAMPEP_0117422016 /NCGR_PEP_ID=MMETSP0758-20121206/2950_1 /TAXON_ID=63605 /ORGANISM="Percolomonas cosmopolitus, Strain AE-1 (ATCC 50343)" /LENGTH=124 /DNA_ID=CAMNT_0005204403 /DNA_START=1375 /DNA_END=1746 /DNA_ORIENTATION=-
MRYMSLSLGYSGYTGTIFGCYLASSHIGYAMIRVLEYSPICSKAQGCFEINLVVMIIPAAAIVYFFMNMVALPIIVKLLHQVYPKLFKQKYSNMVFIGKTPFDNDQYEAPHHMDFDGDLNDSDL